MVNHRGQALPARPGGTPDDLRHEAANLLHSAMVRLLRHARSVDGGMDLDAPRASLLSVLVFGGPLSMSQLAAIEQVSPPAVTKTVAALEAAGLAKRSGSPDDRRVVLVTATPAGRELLEKGRAARVRAIARLFDGASERDLRTLRRAAEVIARRLP